MKRSEMLAAIETYTLRMFPELDVIDVAHFADALLGMQESAGMLPPLPQFKDPGQFSGDSFEYKANDWETEDEI